jgi:molybdate/tungstate transport system ATP-binding protein
MRMKGIKDQSRIEHIADYLNISPILHRHPQTLSGGEKQRVALSRALVIEPDVLLLDEPLSALDPRAQETTRKILKKINNESNITVIHVTHNQTEARILADRIAIMMNGKIEQVGTPEEIFNKPNNGQVAHFVGVENIFKGTVTSVYNGIAQIHVGSITIEAVTEYPVGETVNLCLRPENIILSKTLSKSSARNSFEGEITEIEDMGALARVNVACDDVMLHALVTTQSARSLELMQQERVIASFKATAVHVL